MIDAPSSVLQALDDGNVSYANLVTVNLGDAYDTGVDVVLYLTDYGHDISFNGNEYKSDNNLTEISGISRKASTGSDAVDIVFGVTDDALIDVIRSERYINQPTVIDRVIVENGSVVSDFAIPVRTAWGLSHAIEGGVDDRTITLTIDSVLGDLDGDNGWYAINSSHQQRHPNDFIMRHSSTVMTEEQQKKYTTNFKGTINSEIKPPALPKIYGYKNAELVPIAMLKHRKTHTSYRHYFTTLIYAINIGECNHIDIRNLRMDDEQFDGKIVYNTERDVGGWSARVRTPSDAENGSLLDEENNGDLSFWFEGMDTNEKLRFQNMYGKGLTLLFVKNRNRDDWLSTPPAFTLPIEGAKVYDPRLGPYYPPDFVGPIPTVTTVFSRNPALQYADYLRSTEYGAGKRGVKVSDANIAELADHFDQIPDSIGNDGINSILIDVQVDTGDSIVDNMNIWMEGCRLFTSDYYGEFNIRVETKSAVVWEIDEGDLEGDPEYDSGEFTDRINQLTYTIKQLVPDTSEDAQVGDLVEVDVEATFPTDGSSIYQEWLSEDGGIQSFDSEQLSYVTELEQAYYWTMVDARISRQPRTLTLPVGIKGWLSEVGDIIKFNSTIMDMADSLWRVEEVEEDDDAVELKLIAYDNNFYTPDPDAIPSPADPATKPLKVKLSPVSGLELIEMSGFYYLNWDVLSSDNVTWYAVEIYKDGEIVVDNPRVAQPPLLLENITIGSYEARVTTLGLNDESDVSVFLFTVALPETPTINVTLGNFSVEVHPSVTKRYVGSTFNLRINDTDNFSSAQDKGNAGSFTIANLLPDTDYHIWVRTINIVGESDWATVKVRTLNDNTTLVEFIGLDTDSIIDEVVDELQTQLDDILTDNPQQSITDMVNNIWDIAENEENIITEEKVRITQAERLTAEINDNIAEITRVDQVYADLTSAQATQITQLTSSVGSNSAYIGQVNQTYADITSAQATQITNLTTEVNSKASVSLVNSVQSDADGNSNAISGIRTAVAGSDDQAQTELILSSTIDSVGEIEGKAVLGVTTGGVFTGMAIVGGTSYSGIEFRTNSLILSDTTGSPQLYWNSGNNAWNLAGTLVMTSSGSFAIININKTSAGGQTAYFKHSGGGGNAITAESSGNTIQSATTNSSGAALLVYNTTGGDAIRVSNGDIRMSNFTFSKSSGTTSNVGEIIQDLISRIEALET